MADCCFLFATYPTSLSRPRKLSHTDIKEGHYGDIAPDFKGLRSFPNDPLTISFPFGAFLGKIEKLLPKVYHVRLFVRPLVKVPKPQGRFLRNSEW
jgi:hypothetical protein